MNNNQKKIKIAILFSVMIILAFSYLIKPEFGRYHGDDYRISDNYTEPKLKGAGVWDLTGSPIYIDDNDPAHNWAIIAATNEWCSGSGTLNDPYTIENVTINGMGIPDECILIQNSKAYFVIKNSTIYNGKYHGILLLSTNNGKLIKNDFSNNEQYGIKLIESDNNYILDNIANNHQLTSVSDMSGIYIGSGSDNNEIRGNIVNNNDIGIILFSLDIEINNNLIQNNTANNNRADGIRVYATSKDGGCNYNKLLENTVNNNGNSGIYLYNHYGSSKYNEIWRNTAENNGYHGISLNHDYSTVGSCSANNITENTVYNNTQNGISLEGWTDNNKIIHNNITSNSLYGVLIGSNSHSNSIYINNFSSNNINAYDSGSDNNWDYGRVGNYWNDYSGIDADNNSIGDTPYDILGSAQSKDHYPVVGSFDSVVFYFPSDDTLPINLAIISIIIAFGIVGSIGLIYMNRKRKKQIKFKEKIYEPSKTQLNPTVRKGLYFTPIVVFFVAWWVDVGIAISYLGPYLENLDLGFVAIVDWAFRWAELTDSFLIYTNSLSSFFFGCYSWSIITYFLGTANPQRFRRANKSIWLFYPFWFGMCMYLGLIGAESYFNVWLAIHIIFGIWVALGSIIGFYMVVTYSDKEWGWTPSHTIPRKKSIKIRDFFDRFQAFFFILIISSVGALLSILLWTLISIFWTFLTILLIFLLNYVFSMKINYHTKVKQEEEELLLNDFQVLLRKSKELAEKGDKNFTNKSYRPAIENWEKSINYYEEALKKAVEKDKIKENLKILKESIFNAHKGRANTHNKDGLKAYEKSDLQIAQKEWQLAISSFQSAIDLNKDEKLNFSLDDLQKAIKNTEIKLKQLEIELIILDADNQLKEARSLQKKDLRKAIKMVNAIILKYSEAKEKANKNAVFKPLSETLETKIIKCREFRHRLQDKMDQLIGITPISKKIKAEEMDIIDYKIPSVIEEDKEETLLSIVREFEFIGGQIRFKVGLINNTKFPFTNLKITFNIPDALKWIINEPNYERKGDSLLISKLGVKEKKAVSLYLEPINCMESPINATVSFFDVRDKPHALTMNPKMISITCPIFFTEVDANLARVKSLRRKLAHHDKKIFPLIKSEESHSIFSSIVSVLNRFDIKLTFKDFSEEDIFGEAWFYGITKVKKNQIVIYVLLDDTNKKVEIEVSGNDEQQITAFLAEIGDRTRKQLIHDKIIDIDDDFYDMRISILSNLCPYCYTSISGDLVQKIINGKIIRCKNCDVDLKINER